MNNEIDALKGQEKDTTYELQRLNLLTNKLSEGMQMLSQDSMIMQLIQEQDIIDRKQIGLFGLKKN